MEEKLKNFIDAIDNEAIKTKVISLINHIQLTFPNLHLEIKWKQPMFLFNQTYIIGFSLSKKHLSISPEQETIEHFTEKIKALGFEHSKMIIRLPYQKDLPFDLIDEMIQYQINAKKDHQKFWRES